MNPKKSFKSKCISVLVCMSMILALFSTPLGTKQANAVEPGNDSIEYSYFKWDNENQRLKKYQSKIDNYEIFPETSGDTLGDENGKWYVVNTNAIFYGNIFVNGTANLLIADGCSLTVNGFINVSEGNTLNIYAQSYSSNLGKIIVNNVFIANNSCAGIGGNIRENCGTVNIYGCIISAIGLNEAAGIGGGTLGNGGTITVYDGEITAIGGEKGAGIGGGCYGDGGTITVYGGKITANGGEKGAGIGGGYYGDGGTIEINNGNITANYDAANSPFEPRACSNFGAGIGGGYCGNGGTITINNGTVTAVSSFGAGIGGGYEGSGGKITINNGKVSAVGTNQGAAIGGGNGGNTENDEITINGGQITVDSIDSTCIGGGKGKAGKIIINGGSIKAAPGPMYSIGGSTYTPECKELYIAESLDVIHLGKKLEITSQTNCIPNPVTITECIKYIDYTPDSSEGKLKKEVKLAPAYTIYDYDKSENSIPIGNDKWYVLSGEGEINDRIDVQGTAHLILRDGCDYTVYGGINVGKDSKLYIYAESEGENCGKLTANAYQYEAKAGIGSDKSQAFGQITINGGIIDALGGTNAAGIGGGDNTEKYDLSGSSITINGGMVHALGGTNAAGIGGGDNVNVGDLSGACITINGGNIIATGGKYAAGIGSGHSGNYCESGFKITINDGKINATGGINAAGIGGGLYSYGGDININGGLINSEGGEITPSITAPAIGGGYDTDVNNYECCPCSNLMIADNLIISSSNESFNFIQNQTKTIPEKVYITPHFNYLSYEWNDELNTLVCEEKKLSDFSFLQDTGLNTTIGSDEGSWYVVSDNVLISNSISVTGTANILLLDRSQLTVAYGINVPENANLNIYAQSEGENCGKLIVKNENNGNDNNAGIGGNSYSKCGTITIYGGNLSVTGGEYAAGIGGGYNGTGGKVVIKGGTISAKGGKYGAGIGNGVSNTEKESVEVIIEGGTITASGGENAAGIGGGYVTDNIKITIKDGNIESKGGINGAGIGGGYQSGGLEIVIKGGSTTAKGGSNAAGVGSGNLLKYGGKVSIEGGAVLAIGGEAAAGIGGGVNGLFDSVTITGGTVISSGGRISSDSWAAAIGKGTNSQNVSGDCGSLNISSNMYISCPEGSDFYQQGKTLSIPGEAFVHKMGNWTTFAIDNVLTYVCGDDYCSNFNEDSKPLSIAFTIKFEENAPVYTLGKDYRCSVEADDTGLFKISELKLPEIKYFYGTTDKSAIEGTPVNAGHYTAVISDLGAEASLEFDIAKADISPVTVISDSIYGEGSSVPSVMGNSGNGTVKYLYSNDNVNWTDAVPSKAGEYYVKALIDETDNYNKAETQPVKFEIKKATNPANLSADAFTVTDIVCGKTQFGEISGVSTDMEYSIMDSENWISCTGTTIKGLLKGEYLIRMKKTPDYDAAGEPVSVSIEFTHNYSSEYTTDLSATCLEEGTESRHCTTAGCTASTDSRVIPVKEHTLKTISAVEPTCTENGHKEYYRCSVCKDYFSDIEGKKIINDLYSWLSNEGLTASTGHTFSTEWTYDETSHWHEAVCGHNKTEGKAVHSWDSGTVTTQPTTETTGIKTYKCKVCNASLSVDLPKLDPAGTPVPSGNPTGAPVPSGNPTGAPVPSVNPTGAPVPSGNPTCAPVPSGNPTGAPVPSGNPAGTPVPSGNPTGTPSVTPTGTASDNDGKTPAGAENNNSSDNEEKVTVLTNDDGSGAEIPESFIDNIKLTKDEKKAVNNGAEIVLDINVTQKKTGSALKKNVLTSQNTIVGLLAAEGITDENTGNESEGTTDKTGSNADGTSGRTGSNSGSTSGQTGSNADDSSGNSKNDSVTLTVGPTYNINLTKQIGEADAKSVKTNISNITFTASVPLKEKFVNTDSSITRLYFMVSTGADGNQTVVPADFSSDTNTLSFNAPGNGEFTLTMVDVPFFEAKGTVLKTAKKLNAIYEITAPGNIEGKVGTLRYLGPQTKKASLTVKNTAKINGISYTVTSIENGAFAGNKKLEKLTIGKNISFIGDGAFKGCKNLKEITVNSKLLKAKNLSADTFKGLSKKVTVYVPATKLKAYKTMFAKLGAACTVKVQ